MIAERFKEPPIQNLQRVGAKSWPEFIRRGQGIAAALIPVIKNHFGDKTDSLSILDFGCGCGGVLLPMSIEMPARYAGADVDASAIKYLKGQLPSVELVNSEFHPELPFYDGQFDCVYSISVWSHLNHADQEPWLLEMKRIVRPGGLILISTAGVTVLQRRRKRKEELWIDISDEQLEAEGLVYRSYPERIHNDVWLPGIDGDYGSTLHSLGWIRENWAKHLDIAAIQVLAIGNVQDLVIMRR